MDFFRTVRNVEIFVWLLSIYRPQDGRNCRGLIFSFFLVLSTDGIIFLGLIFSLACVACVAFVAFVAVLKIHGDYAQFPQFRLFTNLVPNSPNLEYFEKFRNFPFPPCVLSFLKVQCHPNIPIIPSATCTRTRR